MILINGFIEFWTFVLNFLESKIEVYVEVDEFLRRFEFRDMMVELDFFAGLRMLLSVLFYFRGFPEDQVCWNTGFDCMFETVGLVVLSGLGCR